MTSAGHGWLQAGPLRPGSSSGSPFETSVGFRRAVRAGARVLVSGTAPIEPDGGCAEDAEAQAERCFAIIVDALERLGAGRHHVVRTRTYIVDPADAEAAGRAHRRNVGGAGPAATMVVVAGLLDPRWRVEIEAEAEIGPPDHPADPAPGHRDSAGAPIRAAPPPA